MWVDLLPPALMSLANANNIDSDQVLHSAASDLCLQCLSKSLFWDTIGINEKALRQNALFCLICGFTSQSTTMVMPLRSIN